MKHVARKRFGQNFLHDAGVIQRIAANINPKAGDHIVEIGPGQGALTQPILNAVDHIDVVELDRDLIPILEKKFAEKITIHSADALKFDFSTLIRNQEKLRIIGNLPYNISTPLIFHLIDQVDCIQDMHFMLQKEVVERLAASPGSKTYGRLGVMVQYYCQVEKLFTVGPGAFNPAPKVDSAIVRLTPHKTPPVDVNNIKNFADIVTRVFGQRRKTLRKVLKGILTEEQIQSLGIDSSVRGENLDLAQFAALSNLV